MKKVILYLAAMLTFTCFGYSQSAEEIKLFLDPDFEIDEDLIKNKVDFVQYVFDRQVADVYIQFLKQETGNAGEKITSLVKASDSIEMDTFVHYNKATATELQKNDNLVLQIKQILLPYLINTTLMSQIDYNIKYNSTEDTITIDPWNNWVFNAGIIGFLEEESTSNSIEGGLKFRASKTINEWTFYNSSYYYYDRTTFSIDDSTNFVNVNERFSNSSRYVKSLTKHWSVGVSTYIGSSTYSNYKYALNIKPTVEYSIFPYKEAGTKTLKFLYRIGPSYNVYNEITQRGKFKDLMIKHTFNAVYAILRDWGELSLNLFADQYVNEPELYSLTIGPVANWNIAKGLTFNCGAYISYIGDRINVPGSNISTEELLLASRIVDTSFSYFSFAGFEYRFGSSNNSIVNTRFDDYNLSINSSF